MSEPDIERVCDHLDGERGAGEFSKLLERWREQRDYLRGLKERGDLTRDWGECSLNHACRVVEDLTAAIAAASLIANQENSLRTQPEPVADGEAVAWRIGVRAGSMTHYAYTERLPFEPPEGSDTVVLRDPEPLYASPPPAEIERLHERCDAYKGQVKCGSEEISRLRKQLADAEATLFKLNSGEELQSLMKLNNELRSQLASAKETINVRLEDLAEANAIYGKDVRLDAPTKVDRNNREISWLKDLRSMLALALSDEVGT